MNLECHKVNITNTNLLVIIFVVSLLSDENSPLSVKTCLITECIYALHPPPLHPPSPLPLSLFSNRVISVCSYKSQANMPGNKYTLLLPIYVYNMCLIDTVNCTTSLSSMYCKHTHFSLFGKHRV